MPAQSSNYNFRFFAAHFNQHGEASVAFHQRRNIAILGAAQKIAFPMTRNRSVFHFRRSFADRDGVDDLRVTVH